MPDACPVRVGILAWPWKAYHGGESLERGVKVAISQWRKFHSSMMPATAKACGQYLNSILALREVAAKGFDEAVLLDVNGSLAEGSGENIFLIRDGVLLTNDARDSILMGVTRDAILTIARDLGIEVAVRALSVEDLHSADEAFFTGTAAEVTPIRAVDGRPIGQGGRGPMTETIQRKFFAIVTGTLPAYRKWLHLVDQQSAALPER